MRKLFQLFVAFFKIGAVTFGGGYAMLPILQRDVVEKNQWCTIDEMMDYFAIGQCTPGIIAVNTATFVGYKQKGIWGGVFATLGVVCPSVIIISIITAFITNFQDIVWVQHALNGIRICVCVLIFNAIMKVGKSALIDLWTWLIFAAVLMLSLIFKVTAVPLVIGAGILGYLICRLKKEDEKHAAS